MIIIFLFNGQAKNKGNRNVLDEDMALEHNLMVLFMHKNVDLYMQNETIQAINLNLETFY